MALMFSRIARNYAKNGYFPTDEATLSRILLALAVKPNSTVRLLDPSSGEGVALAECKHHLTELDASVTALGVEYDVERAAESKKLLDRAIHASFFDCLISPRSIGLLFLNPPYGDLIADKAGTGDKTQGRQRLEAKFLKHAINLLQFGGVLVSIVPHYVLMYLADVLLTHCDQLRIFKTPEDRFKQVVIFGVKRKVSDAVTGTDRSTLKALFTQVNDNRAAAAELPQVAWDSPYVIPAINVNNNDFQFHAIRIDNVQLAEEVARFNGGMWPQFDLRFGRAELADERRPLRKLSDWHLALALSAGLIQGVVRNEQGRVLLVKGDTFKDKIVSSSSQMDDEGNVAITRVHLDRFVPVIRAIEFTEGPAFGRLLTIS